MFTAGAFLLLAAIGWYANSQFSKDRGTVALLTDDEVRTAILHARQDIKLVAYLLGGILLFLGVIADMLR